MPPNDLDPAGEKILERLDAVIASGDPEPLDFFSALSEFEARALEEVRAAGSPAELDALELHLLRQKGELNTVLRSVGKLPAALRKRVGAAANGVRAQVAAEIEARRQSLGPAAPKGPPFDVTLPGRRPFVGRPHVLAAMRDEIVGIFRGMGYVVAEDREVEDDYHNFTALNFGEHHPARDAHDTLFVRGGALLRTHTSSVQIRVMEKTPPPLRMVFPGRVYRAEQIDASHASEFHQLEGLYVDRGVSMAHLKGALGAFARAFFGPDTRTRFRPSYFPFTEPSGEMDVACMMCGGTGRRGAKENGGARCPVCKGSGWLEILGCGMVHPNVLRAVSLDPEEWTGFAFGMGFERVAMLRHGIPDIRHFLENDLRFLEQF